MLLKIDNKEITLKYTLRGYMIFEQVTNHSFNGVGMSDFVILFYSMLMASDKELTITFDDFIDYLDENPQLMGEFSEWISANIAKQTKLSPEKEVIEPKEVDSKNL